MNAQKSIRSGAAIVLGLISALLFAFDFSFAAEQTRDTAKPAAQNKAVPKTAVPTPTVLEIMRAAVQPPADGIWAVESNETLSDQEWLLLDQDATALAAAATLIARPGTNKIDQAWTANANWQAWALDLRKTAFEIRAAAKAKDLMGMSNGAEHLIEVCQNCHDKYRPQTPTDGVVRYPFYPKRVLDKK